MKTKPNSLRARRARLCAAGQALARPTPTAKPVGVVLENSRVAVYLLPKHPFAGIHAACILALVPDPATWANKPLLAERWGLHSVITTSAWAAAWTESDLPPKPNFTFLLP